jgi:hypothetical protein
LSFDQGEFGSRIKKEAASLLKAAYAAKVGHTLRELRLTPQAVQDYQRCSPLQIARTQYYGGHRSILSDSEQKANYLKRLSNFGTGKENPRDIFVQTISWSATMIAKPVDLFCFVWPVIHRMALRLHQEFLAECRQF